MSGICCPRCGCADLKTSHTIKQPGGVKRYRVCRHCGTRLVTREKVEVFKK
jgi:transcriptional regulator NrdR family protein